MDEKAQELVLITNSEGLINAYLKDGWIVKFQPTAQIYTNSDDCVVPTKCSFCFVLIKNS